MSILTASAFLKALGWALVNSLWQFAICWLLYGLLNAPGRKLTAAARHGMGLLLLFAGTFFFLLALCWHLYASPVPAQLTSFPLAVADGNGACHCWQVVSSFMEGLLPWWSMLYLVCIFVLFIKLCFFVGRAGNLRHHGTTKMNADWRLYVQRVATQLGIRREVKALLSIHVDTPQVIGFLKPLILLPAACLNNLTSSQLEAVLLHELVHIKRNDYFINLFIASVEIIFFFNPFVKQITAGIRKEREYSCDDMVIQFEYHPHQYAAALLTLEKSRLIPVTYGIAASGKNQQQLLTRIERIVGVKNKQPGFYRARAGLAALLLLFFVAGIHSVKINALTPVIKSDAPALLPGNSHATVTAVHYTLEGQTHFNYLHIAATAATGAPSAKKNDPMSLPANTGYPENRPVHLTDAGHSWQDAADNAADLQVLDAASKEARNFSVMQKAATPVPETIDPQEAAAEPYVPASNFSFQFIQDTNAPKIKGQTYTEQQANEARVKAQKAMAEINWQAIEKKLKYSQHDLAKLKRELALQLQSLNWQRINVDAQNELNQQQFGNIQEARMQNQAIQQYQQRELLNEVLQKQLTEQAQLIKATDLHAQEVLKTMDQQQKKLQLEMKKRKIIYI